MSRSDEDDMEGRVARLEQVVRGLAARVEQLEQQAARAHNAYARRAAKILFGYRFKKKPKKGDDE